MLTKQEDLVIGQTYKIVSETYGHSFPIGEIVRFIGGGEYDVFEYLDGSDFWYVSYTEVEEIEK